MDEEFFFPQNVRTTYRLWLLGPRQLKRLAVAPVLALLIGWALHGLSFLVAAIAAGLLASVYGAVFCLPLLSDEQTLSDIGLEVLRHRRTQSTFAHGREVNPPGILDQLDT
jgi:hypothetical protein